MKHLGLRECTDGLSLEPSLGKVLRVNFEIIACSKGSFLCSACHTYMQLMSKVFMAAQMFLALNRCNESINPRLLWCFAIIACLILSGNVGLSWSMDFEFWRYWIVVAIWSVLLLFWSADFCGPAWWESADLSTEFVCKQILFFSEILKFFIFRLSLFTLLSVSRFTEMLSSNGCFDSCWRLSSLSESSFGASTKDLES